MYKDCNKEAKQKGKFIMAKQDDEKKYYVDNARLREVIIEYNRMNIDDNR